MAAERGTAIRPQLRPGWLFAVALGGAVLGTAWDRMHVAAGTLFYTPPGRFHQPWWVPLEFGMLFLSGALGILRFGDPLPDERSPRRAAAELAVFSAVYGMTALLWRRPGVLIAVLIALLVIRLPALQKTGGANMVPAAMLVIGGPVMEASLSAAGLFAYASPDIAGVPLWLPLLYMNAVPFAVRTIEAAWWFGGPRRSTTQAPAV
jgi:hypothetical protein